VAEAGGDVGGLGAARPGTEVQDGKQRLALICHWPADASYWVADALAGQGYRVTRFSRPWGRKRRSRRLSFVWLGIRAGCFAQYHRCPVVADYDGNMAGLVAALLGAHVLCLNLIFREHHKLRRKLLYRAALANPHTLFTASSETLCEHYATFFRARRQRFIALPDCYKPEDRNQEPTTSNEYVFCGGAAARDWPAMLAVAKARPEIPFLFIARRAYWPGLAVPPNVRLKFDVPLGEFFQATRGSQVFLILLTDEVMTAGLIVLKQAAFLGAVPICTRTEATEAYVADDTLLVDRGDSGTAAALVDTYWRDPVRRRQKAEEVRAYVLEHHSPERYAAMIAQTLHSHLA
jgi:hypothetical protein